MKRGKIVVKNNGVLIPTTIGTVITRSKEDNQEWILLRSVTSIVSTSLLNLFKMRPNGVVSKKFMGERTILLKIEACSLLEALTLPKYNDTAPATKNTPANKPRLNKS